MAVAQSIQVPATSRTRSNVRYMLEVGGLALGVGAAAWFGLLFAFQPTEVSLVWPPAGIGIAAIVLLGYRVWPGIAIGIAVSTMARGYPLPQIAADVAANTLEAIAAAFLLSRFVAFRPSLDRLSDVLGFAAAAAIVAAGGATIGVAGLLAAATIPTEEAAEAWRVWWLGDVLGLIIFGQFLVAWGAAERPTFAAWRNRKGAKREARVRALEALALLAGTVVVSQYALGSGSTPGEGASRGYLVFPLLAWSALRFGPRGAATANLVVGTIAAYDAAQNIGPFATPDVAQSAGLLAGFLIVVSVTAQILAAVGAERRSAQGTSRSMSDMFDAVIRASPLAITAVDPSGVVILWNPAAETIYGWSADEVMGRPLPIIPPTEDATTQELIARGLLGETVGPHRTHRLRRDGSLAEVQLSGAPLRDSTGAIVGVLGLAADVTQGAEAERALVESTELFRQLAEGIDEVFWLASVDDGQPVYISRAYEAMAGRSRDEAYAAGELFADLVHPGDREAVAAAAVERAAALETFEDIEYRIGRPDGETRWLRDRIWPIRDELGNVSRFGGLTTDVTERKLAEEALHESNATLRAIVDASPVGVIVTDREGRIRLWSPAAERIFGWTSGEVLGGIGPMTPADPADESRLILQRTLFGLTVTGLETQQRRKDESVIDLSYAAAPMRAADGSIVGTLILATDITERKGLEAQLIQADKMQSVGRLAGGVAHDFNNLLTAIRGYSDLLLAELDPSSPSRTDVEAIRQASDQAASLTSQLLAFSRRQVLAPEVLDINDVVAGVEPLLARLIGEDVSLRARLMADSGWVSADQGQLEQVIVNLAVNARDAMPHGGSLIVETGIVALDEDYARRHLGVTPGDYVQLTVTDTGLGLDETTKGRIFEPFFTTKERGKGTGLGLAMVYGTVRQSGGHITVESEPGQGTTFRVFLPRVQAPERERLQATIDPTPVGGSERLLLVEDDAAVRELTKQILTRYGYEVTVANDATQAIALTRQPEGPLIDLLVTDVIMPGLSGRELAELLTAVRPDLRVLYLSGYTDDQILRHGVLEPGVAFLPKPFTPEALARKVREVLGTRPASRT